MTENVSSEPTSTGGTLVGTDQQREACTESALKALLAGDLVTAYSVLQTFLAKTAAPFVMATVPEEETEEEVQERSWARRILNFW